MRVNALVLSSEDDTPVQPTVIGEGALQEMAAVFQALGDPSRLRLVDTLMAEERCVGDLVGLLGLSQPAVSHHLKELRQLGLVQYRKAGRTVFYRADSPQIRLLYEQCRRYVDGR